jgi:hypothetical protein
MRKLLLIVLVAASACAARTQQTSIPTAYGAAGTGDDAIVARYLQGESLDELAGDLRLGDRDEARGVVHRAMENLQRRYYLDH